jgi:signal transduction histidine kinase
VHVQTSEVGAAKLNARRAAAFVSHLRGGRFHEADMLLLDLELRLRARLREGNLESGALESAEVERTFKRVERIIKGSALIDVRLRALRLYDRFLRGQVKGSEVEFAEVSALARRASKRIEHVLKEIDTRRGESAALVIAESDARRQREFSLLERFGRLVRADGSGDEAASLLTFLLAAEGCDVRIEREEAPAKDKDAEAKGPAGDDPKAIAMIPGEDKLEVVVRGGGQRVHFVLRKPMVELCFDERVTELVRLAGEVIRVAMERRQIFHLQRQVVLARTMQMLVHDVRRPFGALQAVMKAIAAAPPEEVHATIGALLPEVQEASATVSTLIDDVVDLGNDRAPRREAVLPELIVDECIREALRPPGARAISVTYELGHTRAFHVEGVRVRRMVINLMTNAVQALGGEGNLWVRSKDDGEQIEMVVGNDGPPIADEDLPHLFDAFFTKGKAGGTGLGLAVAHHVVTSHGGRIACRRASRRGVEFVFTLPASPQVIDARSAEELRARLPRRGPIANGALVVDAKGAPEARAELSSSARQLLGRLSYVGRQIDVLIVGNEAGRLATMGAWLTESAPAGAVRVACHTGIAAAMAVVHERAPDLAILALAPGGDVDRSVSLLRALVAATSDPYVCVEMVGASPDDVQRASAERVNVVQTTPVERADAHRWLVAVAARLHPSSSRRGGERPAKVALVDDSRVHLADWRSALQGDADLVYFPSPAAFWAEAERDASFVPELDVVIVDYVFLDCDDDGVTFARQLKKRRRELPVCLSTSGYGLDAELAGAIDVVLDKSAISWPALLARVGPVRSKTGDERKNHPSQLEHPG